MLPKNYDNRRIIKLLVCVTSCSYCISMDRAALELQTKVSHIWQLIHHINQGTAQPATLLDLVFIPNRLCIWQL